MTQIKSFQFNLADLRKQLAASSLHAGDLLVGIGKYFLGAPYQAGTLDGARREKVIVNFTGFDCLTFVETVLALAHCARERKMSVRELRRQLQLIRYREGIINGYSSRLHYTLEWLTDNEKKLILRNITADLPRAEKFKKEINFMSAHKERYPPLSDPETYNKITAQEKEISQSGHFYITAKDVSSALKMIMPGDLICFTAKEEGLDIAHVGIAVCINKSIRLLHASRKEKGVIISAASLKEYLGLNKKFTGIIAARCF